MCGIVGACAERDVVPILIEGLKRLEYRGYDSAGIAVIERDACLTRHRTLGKVKELANFLTQTPLVGKNGVAHTRWATHGQPSEKNAHPHQSQSRLALVHNGIIENYEVLRDELMTDGYHFDSETDSEVIVHALHRLLSRGHSLMESMRAVADQLTGAFALGIIDREQPNRMVAMRMGSPLVVGIGIGEHFIASDSLALLPVTQQFIYLEDGDIADIQRDSLTIFDFRGEEVTRPVTVSPAEQDINDKGAYRHYMKKEIAEQPTAITETIEGRIGDFHVFDQAFGTQAEELFKTVKHVYIVACGTSYHAGMVARYWLESLAGLSCTVEVASEFRYRDPVILANTLFLTISQSGETADTLAALKMLKTSYSDMVTLSICNVAQSSLVRESLLKLLTRAGVEIGVASTKAFTTQLVALLLLTLTLARHQGRTEREKEIIESLMHLPQAIQEVLELDDVIKELAEQFTDRRHALFLGRGTLFPIALEGALKLKEISYIHAEGYPAGELKHGPLALVDKEMPVVAVVPKDDATAKIKSNLQEVHARGGNLMLFADQNVGVDQLGAIIRMPSIAPILSPILYTIPLQLLAYHVAVLKGTDVDQPRNLAKSVTVE